VIRESVRFDDIPMKRRARLLDAFADNADSVFISYEAEDDAKDSLCSVLLVPTEGDVPETEGFLASVTGSGIGTLHVYVDPPD
jgi:hypothetical protein